MVVDEDCDRAVLRLNVVAGSEIGIGGRGRAVDQKLIAHGNADDGGRHGCIRVGFLLGARAARNSGDPAGDVCLMKSHITHILSLIRDVDEHGEPTGNAIVAKSNGFGETLRVGGGGKMRCSTIEFRAGTGFGSVELDASADDWFARTIGHFYDRFVCGMRRKAVQGTVTRYDGYVKGRGRGIFGSARKR